MTLRLAPLLLLLAVSKRDEVELVYAPEPGTRLTRTFEAVADYELADLALSVEGEPVDAYEEIPEFAMHFVERIVVTDELAAVDGGRATELVRRFDELAQETTQTSAEEERTVASSSPFEGRTLRFTWDDDAEAHAVAADDDGELDDSLAAWLHEDMDLRHVLPDGPVEVGDEWEVDVALYLAFMWPGGLLDFRDEGDEEEPTDEDRAGSRQTIENLAGEGTAVLAELREEDGVRVAVIRVELEVETGSTGEALEVEIERTLEGTILWDLDHGHALSAELEADASRLVTRAGTLEGEDGPVDVEHSELMEGTIRYTATFERE